MTMPIEGATAGVPLLTPHLTGERGLGAVDANSGDGAVPFADTLKKMIGTANDHAARAQQMSESFAAGTLDDIHGTMIAVKQADIELRMVASVRNKLVEAFNDLWRMNI